MPAISVYARLEMHLTDEELRTLAALARELVEDHRMMFRYRRNQGRASSRDIAQLNALGNLYAATQRTMLERNMAD